MSDAARKLLEQAMELSPEERLRIAEELVDSVREPLDPEWEQAWRAELDLRLAELRAGTTRPLSWDEMRERLRATPGR